MTSEVESFTTRNFVTFPNIEQKQIEICILDYVTWPYLVSGHGKKSQKLTKMPITFDTVAQIQ